MWETVTHTLCAFQILTEKSQNFGPPLTFSFWLLYCNQPACMSTAPEERLCSHWLRSQHCVSVGVCLCMLCGFSCLPQEIHWMYKAIIHIHILGAKNITKEKDLPLCEAFLTVFSSPRRPSYNQPAQWSAWSHFAEPLHPRCHLLLVAVGSGCLPSPPLVVLAMHL